MQATDRDWSQAEKAIAETAMSKAYEREIGALLAEVREWSSEVSATDDLWRLHDFLSTKRHEIDGKYDSRDSSLMFVFAQLIKEGWLNLKDLEGIAAEKLTKVTALTRM